MTKPIYEIIDNGFGGEIILRHNEDESISSIPADPANRDYQVYLQSLEESNN